MDFSSAFNAVQPHVLTRKLLNLEVSPDLALCGLGSVGMDRPQRVTLRPPVCELSDPV